MSKKNDDFFKEKKPWSEVKDELLGCYLKPYIQKVLWTGKPIVYIDCFAGKGVFDDGTPGSPLIALETIKQCVSHTQAQNCNINPYFIDLNYASDLKVNLAPYNVPDKNIIGGKYEDKLKGILLENEGSNIFLYIDPYGIKDLDCYLFDELALSKKFNSVELLINLNSYGIIRECCRVLGVHFGDETLLEGLVEYETTKLDKNESSVKLLNKIAGGEYWKDIILRKNRHEIDTKEAEKLFAEQYCERLKKHYKYVLNMPLRIKKGHPTKYRMVHATNHVEGCLIMVNNICNRWELMKEIQTGGQMSLFSEDIENNIISESGLSDKVQKHIQKYTYFERLNEILADFFMLNGPICTTGKINEIYKELEKYKKIEVIRKPAYTDKKKMPSTFFADEKGKTTQLRWKL